MLGKLIDTVTTVILWPIARLMTKAMEPNAQAGPSLWQAIKAIWSS